MTAFGAMDIGGLNGRNGIQCRHQVRDWNADFGRRAAAFTGYGHQPGHPLNDGIIGAFIPVGTILSEAGNGAVDDSGMKPT